MMKIDLRVRCTKIYLSIVKYVLIKVGDFIDMKGVLLGAMR